VGVEQGELMLFDVGEGVVAHAESMLEELVEPVLALVAQSIQGTDALV
jgi:hypothetical protein